MARLAYSLDKLRSQVNAAYPNRNKASDGWIADTAHSLRASDHNPNAAGVVCGLDLTHDPATFDAHATADRLRVHRHPDLKYIISNQRIAGAWSGWAWQPYSGVNPHTKHIHISVGVGSDGQSRQPYDDTDNWSIQGEEMIIQNEPNWKARCNKIMYQIRGRNIGDVEFQKYAVGAEFLHWVEAVSDNAEADKATNWQNVGRVAVTDKWAEQIYALQDQVRNLGKRPTEEELAVLNAKVTDLTDSLTRANEKVSELETQQATDTQKANSFLRIIGQLLNKFNIGG